MDIHAGPISDSGSDANSSLMDGSLVGWLMLFAAGGGGNPKTLQPQAGKQADSLTDGRTDSHGQRTRLVCLTRVSDTYFYHRIRIVSFRSDSSRPH